MFFAGPQWDIVVGINTDVAYRTAGVFKGEFFYEFHESIIAICENFTLEMFTKSTYYYKYS